LPTTGAYLTFHLFSPAIGCVDYDWAIKSHIYRQLTQIVRSWQVFNSFLLQKAVCGITLVRQIAFAIMPLCILIREFKMPWIAFGTMVVTSMFLKANWFDRLPAD
jgi:hypothetical protein